MELVVANARPAFGRHAAQSLDALFDQRVKAAVFVETGLPGGGIAEFGRAHQTAAVAGGADFVVFAFGVEGGSGGARVSNGGIACGGSRGANGQLADRGEARGLQFFVDGDAIIFTTPEEKRQDEKYRHEECRYGHDDFGFLRDVGLRHDDAPFTEIY